MDNVSRRTVLAVGGAGLAAAGAGCLGTLTGSNETNDDDPSGEREERSDLSSAARWIPATITEDLFFSYADLETVRAHETHLADETVDEIPFAPRGAGGRIVRRIDDEPTFRSVLEFGPEGDGGHYVMRGEFDLDGLAVGDPVDEVDSFAVFEAAGASIAASNDTLIVVDPEFGAIDDVLAAGIDGTDRRSDADDAFATVLEHVGEETLAFGLTPGSADAGGTVMGQSWAVESETTSFTRVMVGGGASELDEDELKSKLADRPLTDGFETLSVEIEGDAAVATGSLPTPEFQYTDSIAKLHAGISRPVSASISIDVDTATGTVTVTLTSIGIGGHVEVRDGDGPQATLTDRGDESVLEYEVGASAEISVVAVAGDQESVIATETVEF